MDEQVTKLDPDSRGGDIDPAYQQELCQIICARRPTSEGSQFWYVLLCHLEQVPLLPWTHLSLFCGEKESNLWQGMAEIPVTIPFQGHVSWLPPLYLVSCYYSVHVIWINQSILMDQFILSGLSQGFDETFTQVRALGTSSGASL